MLMGKVVGNVVSTRKNEKIIGSTILEIRLMENRQETDKYIIAIDSLGAGIGETVLVTTGSSGWLCRISRRRWTRWSWASSIINGCRALVRLL